MYPTFLLQYNLRIENKGRRLKNYDYHVKGILEEKGGKVWL